MLTGSGVGTSVELALKLMLAPAPRVSVICSSSAYGDANEVISVLESPENDPVAVIDGEIVGALIVAGHPAVWELVVSTQLIKLNRLSVAPTGTLPPI